MLLLVSLLLCYVKEGESHFSNFMLHDSVYKILYFKKTIGSCQDDCAQGFPDIADSSDQSSDSLTRQFVMPQYTFHCSAIITQWEAIVHIEKQSYSIEFQIWRWNHTVNGYQLVGSNQFYRKQASSGMQKEVKQTFSVKPDVQLQVAPADIVGVFASGISVHYKSDDVINVYAAEEVDHPLVGIFAPQTNPSPLLMS